VVFQNPTKPLIGIRQTISLHGNERDVEALVIGTLSSYFLNKSLLSSSGNSTTLGFVFCWFHILKQMKEICVSMTFSDSDDRLRKV